LVRTGVSRAAWFDAASERGACIYAALHNMRGGDSYRAVVIESYLS
jgi:hypothetical protein